MRESEKTHQRESVMIMLYEVCVGFWWIFFYDYVYFYFKAATVAANAVLANCVELFFFLEQKYFYRQETILVGFRPALKTLLLIFSCLMQPLINV